jgi:hypothetical protein
MGETDSFLRPKRTCVLRADNGLPWYRGYQQGSQRWNNVSTRMWRLRPLTCLCASKPLMAADSSTVFTRCASTMAALGCGFLPCRSRSSRWSARSRSVQVPYASQAPEMIEHGLPRREVGWQGAPRAAGAQNREDRIKNGTQGVEWWPATPGLRRQVAL